MLRKKALRRAAGATLVTLGALLMWMAPGPTFGARSVAGLALLVAGIALEIAGIALEHRDRSRKP
jgi:hypothetical protein